MGKRVLGCHRLLWLWVAAGMVAAIGRGDTLVDGFSDVTAWTPNADGGNPPQILLDADGEDESCLRLVYRDEEPHWGNVVRDLSIPPGATALRFRLRVHRASPEAALHVWFFEKDNDGHLVRVRPENRDLHELGEGWHTAVVPFTTLNFQPRGNGKRAFMTINRMLFAEPRDSQ